MQGAEARKWLNRGNYQLLEISYRMKIGPFLAEILPKRELLSQSTPQKTNFDSRVNQTGIIPDLVEFTKFYFEDVTKPRQTCSCLLSGVRSRNMQVTE